MHTMNHYHFFLIALGLTGAAAAAAAVWCLRLRPAGLPKYEKLPRNRFWGGLLGTAALLWYVPYARVVVFDFMVPLLWPLALVCAVLGYCYLDYLFSRALGGVFVLLAYFFVHGAFAWNLPGAAALSVGMWLLGCLGIAFSGKPCWMRDLIRKMCASPPVRRGFAAYFALLGIVCLTVLALGLRHV